MALTSRKKRPLNRSVPHLGDTRLIIIAAEGQKTEQQYFSLFHDTRVQVKVLSTGADNRSSPGHVIERLNAFKEEFNIGDGDELWLMVDVDRWTPQTLGEVSREALQRGYGLAVSNPCFEVWLLCHFQIPPADVSACRAVENVLREALDGGYNKARLDISRFFDQIETAVKRAVELDANPEDRWPQNVGTHVYRVVQSISQLVRA